MGYNWLLREARTVAREASKSRGAMHYIKVYLVGFLVGTLLFCCMCYYLLAIALSME